MLTHTSTAAAPATSVAVSARRVTRHYGDGESAVHALRGVSLEVPAGQFTAVMGPSGSGKSTLMHMLAGLDRPTNGRVKIGDVDITEMPDKQLTRAAPPGDRLRLPAVQPAADADGGGEHPPAALDRRPQGRQGRDAVADRARRPRRPPAPQAVAAVRRPAAARGHRPRAGHAPDGAVRRRADRQPRLHLGRRGPHAAARGRRARPPDHRHGHPRPARGRQRRPRPVPGRRPDRQRPRRRPTRSRSSPP